MCELYISEVLKTLTTIPFILTCSGWRPPRNLSLMLWMIYVHHQLQSPVPKYYTKYLQLLINYHGIESSKWDYKASAIYIRLQGQYGITRPI